MSAELIETLKDPKLGIIEIWESTRLKRVHIDQSCNRVKIMLPDRNLLKLVKQRLNISGNASTRQSTAPRSTEKIPDCIGDGEFGEIKIDCSARRSRMSVSVINGQVVVKLGSSTPMERVLKFIDENRDVLRKFMERDAMRKYAPRVYDESTQFQTLTFSLHIYRHKLSNVLANIESGELKIFFPESIDIHSASAQKTIRSIILNALKFEAKRLLPKRITELAQAHGFKFLSVAIHSASTRWGSCSSEKKINLSCYLMLLPQHLIDYVILHELCHTIEMNHGPHFHQLLDQICGGNDKKYDNEIKKYVPMI